MPRPANFGSFCGKDNRKLLWNLLGRLGHGVSHEQACARRACFIRGLLGQSKSPLAKRGIVTGNLETHQSYAALTAITGVLGVDIEKAAVVLEKEVRNLVK
jgi:hypothetical protein